MACDFVLLLGPRACGKSSVAAAMKELLAGWRAVDLDHEYESRHGPQRQVAPPVYFARSRELLLEFLEQPRLVVALGGGTFINAQDQVGDFDLAARCRKRGPLVLLLPSWFDWRSKRVLYRRELHRGYAGTMGAKPEKLRELCYSQFEARIGFFRTNADSVVYGGSVARCARKIIARYHLQSG